MRGGPQLAHAGGGRLTGSSTRTRVPAEGCSTTSSSPRLQLRNASPWSAAAEGSRAAGRELQQEEDSRWPEPADRRATSGGGEGWPGAEAGTGKQHLQLSQFEVLPVGPQAAGNRRHRVGLRRLPSSGRRQRHRPGCGFLSATAAGPLEFPRLPGGGTIAALPPPDHRHNVLLDGALGIELLHRDGAGLAHAPGAAHSLVLQGGVERWLQQEDVAGSGEVDAHRPRGHGEKKDGGGGVALKVPDGGSALLHRHAAADGPEAEALRPQPLLEPLHRAHKLGEDQGLGERVGGSHRRQLPHQSPQL
mmetsp:Transcript_10617/g.30225  ORF Transcript_10617/g.30225 Transcript_10617/m.30225 type:complete len:304 (+) Transcript_10617:107-1018(+)